MGVGMSVVILPLTRSAAVAVVRRAAGDSDAAAGIDLGLRTSAGMAAQWAAGLKARGDIRGARVMQAFAAALGELTPDP